MQCVFVDPACQKGLLHFTASIVCMNCDTGSNFIIIYYDISSNLMFLSSLLLVNIFSDEWIRSTRSDDFYGSQMVVIQVKSSSYYLAVIYCYVQCSIV